VNAGELEKADALLAEIADKQTALEEQFAINRAATLAKRGEVALGRLRYVEAAKYFADAANTIPAGDDYAGQRRDYLLGEASALYMQGDGLGDNAALKTAIKRWRYLLDLTQRSQLPLEWAATQSNLGNALQRLGARESDTAELEDAVAAFRAA